MFQYLNVVAENIHFIALKGPLQGGMGSRHSAGDLFSLGFGFAKVLNFVFIKEYFEVEANCEIILDYSNSI